MDCPELTQVFNTLMPVGIVWLAALVAWLPFEIAQTICVCRERAQANAQATASGLQVAYERN